MIKWIVLAAIIALASCGHGSGPTNPSCHGDDWCQSFTAALFTDDTTKVRAFGDTLSYFRAHGPLLTFRDGMLVPVVYVSWGTCKDLC